MCISLTSTTARFAASLRPGVVSTLAGTADLPGRADGVGGNALFSYPSGVAVDTNDNVYVADTYNSTIRMITPAHVVSTIAGSSTATGWLDAMGTNALFNYPTGLAVDTNGVIYVADNLNQVIRMVTPQGTNWSVTTIAGLRWNAGLIDGTRKRRAIQFPLQHHGGQCDQSLCGGLSEFDHPQGAPLGPNWVVRSYCWHCRACGWNRWRGRQCRVPSAARCGCR